MATGCQDIVGVSRDVAESGGEDLSYDLLDTIPIGFITSTWVHKLSSKLDVENGLSQAPWITLAEELIPGFNCQMSHIIVSKFRWFTRVILQLYHAYCNGSVGQLVRALEKMNLGYSVLLRGEWRDDVNRVISNYSNPMTRDVMNTLEGGCSERYLYDLEPLMATIDPEYLRQIQDNNRRLQCLEIQAGPLHISSHFQAALPISSSRNGETSTSQTMRPGGEVYNSIVELPKLPRKCSELELEGCSGILLVVCQRNFHRHGDDSELIKIQVASTNLLNRMNFAFTILDYDLSLDSKYIEKVKGVLVYVTDRAWSDGNILILRELQKYVRLFHYLCKPGMEKSELDGTLPIPDQLSNQYEWTDVFGNLKFNMKTDLQRQLAIPTVPIIIMHEPNIPYSVRKFMKKIFRRPQLR